MELKDRIIEESIKQFFQRGVRAITMDDVAKKMGISKRTLYEMFKDKDDLLVHCLQFFDGERKRVVQQVRETAPDIIAVFFSFLQLGVQSFKTINPLFVLDLKKYHYEVWYEFDRQFEIQDIELNTSILSEGIEEGLFRSDINKDVVTKILMAQMRILADEEVFPSNQYSKMEVFENILINYVRGISTEKGIRKIDERLDRYRQGVL